MKIAPRAHTPPQKQMTPPERNNVREERRVMLGQTYLELP